MPASDVAGTAVPAHPGGRGAIVVRARSSDVRGTAVSHPIDPELSRFGVTRDGS
jgi:hypothetical protein